MNYNFQIRSMTRPEVDIAVEMAFEEGWNPGLNDASCFYETDPEGFLIGLLDGRPAGCISAVAYGQEFAFVGFYVVSRDLRGQGLGTRLWKAAMERLDGYNIGLDGVPAREQNYIKSGFRTAYRNARFEGLAGRIQPGRGPLTAELTENDFDSVLAYDRECFPAGRASFLRQWLSQPGAKALGVFNGSRLLGYGAIRPCRKGYKVGPLFADSLDVADSLLCGLVSRLSGSDVFYLDVPGPNAAALALAEKYDMHEVFATLRMYTRGAPSIALDRVYGVTTFELG